MHHVLVLPMQSGLQLGCIMWQEGQRYSFSPFFRGENAAIYLDNDAFELQITDTAVMFSSVDIIQPCLSSTTSKQ